MMSTGVLSEDLVDPKAGQGEVDVPDAGSHSRDSGSGRPGIPACTKELVRKLDLQNRRPLYLNTVHLLLLQVFKRAWQWHNICNTLTENEASCDPL